MTGKHYRPKIGLALGSGSARGWSHIGVIHALAEQGIEPDIITGSSIGALVAAAYAKGDLDPLEEWVRQLRWKEIVDLMDISFMGGGFLKGDNLMQFFMEKTNDIKIEDLDIPYGAVTTDLDTGREIWIQNGSLLDAVRSSIALPGLFTPVKRDGRWHVDGGLVNPVPVSLCRAMGAEIVIAVNLNGDVVGKHRREREKEIEIARKKESKAEVELWDRFIDQFKNSVQSKKEEWLKELFGSSKDMPGMFEVLASSINIMQDRITRINLAVEPPDMLIQPRLGQLKMMDFDQVEQTIEEGYISAKEKIEHLKKLLEFE